MAERYDLTPRLATIAPTALQTFVETWAQGNGVDGVDKAKRALREEFDIERLAARFQAAF